MRRSVRSFTCSVFQLSVDAEPVRIAAFSMLRSNVARSEGPCTGDEAPPRGCQMQRNLRRCIETVQQHFHIRHVPRRLTRLGKLLKRDQGSREGLPELKFSPPAK